MRRRLVVLGTLLALTTGGARTLPAADVDYLRDIKPLLKRRCYACHGSRQQESSLRLDTATAIRKGGDSGAAIAPDDFATSLLLQRVTSADDLDRMPPEGDPLSPEEINLLRAWIRAGGTGPADELGEPDPKSHWAFQPLDVTTPLQPPGFIDRLITARLLEAGLQRNPPASTTTLIRRMFLDMHGLPPTVVAMRKWSARLNEHKDGDQTRHQRAVSDLIETLLASPRYGERWAQHWLDVVRYADTHGFEVNTSRPNAWPYRDYVIRALNHDKPYNDFILDQLAGDTRGEDAATGFLVAAAVLLPGQIGKDDASIRLARQDALDEMIVGTTATLVGATLGCARCHDHKFDPFTQEDYYAMQAFFAGVDYGDREIRDPTREQRIAEAARLATRIDQLREQLKQFEPRAFTGRTIIIDDEDLSRVTLLAKKNGHGANPAGTQRGFRDDAGDALRTANLSKGRYTWWPNQLDRDVFTWNPSVAGTYRVWISWGAHGSGVHTRDARYLLDQDGKLETRDDQTEIAKIDQYYFAGVTRGESEKKPLWSGLHDAGVHPFSPSTRLVLRGGQTGTGITADVLVLQEPDAEPLTAKPLPHIRPPLSARLNIEQFAPLKAKYVRFTTLATIDDNRHQPCIDELEVFSAGTGSRNVALASNGTQATSSGNYSETGIHQLKHVNDGQYGNSHSWISNRHGGGWVQLEFPQAETIDRIEWSRDRLEKFKDRLATRYQISVSLDGDTWATVAQSDDRAPMGTPDELLPRLKRIAATTGSVAALPELTGELERLQSNKAALEKPQLVYAGTFREPEVTKVLRRGDPEQPLEIIAPRVPESLGKTTCDPNAPEAERRLALARWISSPANPLTARVIVNRTWQNHFGRGLVDTPSDFGLNGARPSHPELLDRLAIDFVQHGWSLKQLHRLILSSATYQQAATINPAGKAIDTDSRLLWRFPSRRLEAEAIRDSMLAVSGRLNLEMGGPGFNFFQTRGGLSGFTPVESFTPNELRRMIYAHRIRMESVPVFGAFDCPDAGQPTPTRSRSTTAIQALNLFNSPFVMDQAVALAERAGREAETDLSTQVNRVWLLAVGRTPTPTEASASLHAAQEYGLATVCRALFNSNEFLFLP